MYTLLEFKLYWLVTNVQRASEQLYELNVSHFLISFSMIEVSFFILDLLLTDFSNKSQSLVMPQNLAHAFTNNRRFSVLFEYAMNF